jgi:hypothetical protein
MKRLSTSLIVLTFLLSAGGCFDFNFNGSGDAGVCPATCDSCGAGEDCVKLQGQLLGPSFQATCLKRCTTTRDCAQGERCYIDGSLFLPVSGSRFCVGESSLSTCPQLFGGECQAPESTECLDEHTIAQGVKRGDLCGFEAGLCPSRCVPATASDGGSADGGVDRAHCE